MSEIASEFSTRIEVDEIKNGFVVNMPRDEAVFCKDLEAVYAAVCKEIADTFKEGGAKHG